MTGVSPLSRVSLVSLLFSFPGGVFSGRALPIPYPPLVGYRPFLELGGLVFAGLPPGSPGCAPPHLLAARESGPLHAGNEPLCQSAPHAPSATSIAAIEVLPMTDQYVRCTNCRHGRVGTPCPRHPRRPHCSGHLRICAAFEPGEPIIQRPVVKPKPAKPSDASIGKRRPAKPKKAPSNRTGLGTAKPAKPSRKAPMVNVLGTHARTVEGDLQCGLTGLDISRARDRVDLHLPAYHCVHMPGAIRLATYLLPGVREIRTFSGSEPDTIYLRTAHGWEARFPKGGATAENRPLRDGGTR